MTSLIFYAVLFSLSLVSFPAGAETRPDAPARAPDPALVREVREATAAKFLGTLEYYLLPADPGLAAKVAGLDAAGLLPAPAAGGAAGEPADRLLEDFTAAVSAALALDAGGAAELGRARHSAAAYLSLSHRPLFEAVPAPADMPPASTAGARQGFQPRVERLDTGAIALPDVKEYVESRVGALGNVLERLNDGGVDVLFTPGHFEDAAGLFPCVPGTVYRLNFPGSAYAMRAHLLFCSDRGGAALVFSDFNSRSRFTHVQLLFRTYFSLHGMSPAVRVDERPFDAWRDDLFLTAFSTAGALPRKFSGLLLGHYPAAKAAFSPFALKEYSGPGFKAFTARVEGRDFVELDIVDSWYGEGLARSLRRLLDSGVEFDTLYFVGSAGAVTYQPPYSVTAPACFRGPEGKEVSIENVFAVPGRRGCHQTVESPLLETVSYIEALRGAGVRTIDVEGFHLVRAIEDFNRASGRRVRMGIAYMATDYPLGSPLTRAFVLARPAREAKRRGERAFADALLRHIRTGERLYEHPLEGFLQVSVSSLSAANLARLEGGLSPFSAGESALIDKMSATFPPAILRMSPSRFRYALRDGIVISPLQVEVLKGSPTASGSWTTASENALFGAWDYLFIGVGQNDRERYGPVRVFVSTGALADRAYATPVSGYRMLKAVYGDGRLVPQGGELDRSRGLFGAGVVAPEHFSRRLALLAVEGVRRAGREKGADFALERLGRMLKAKTGGELYRVLDEDEQAYLEGKVLRYLDLSEIACVELPAKEWEGLRDLPGAALLEPRVRFEEGACLR